jgi:N-sulfoglucosamine sulfohydrolase
MSASHQVLNATSRRSFLSAACMMPAVFQLRAGTQPTERRPNILLCLGDDYAWPHAGIYGDKVVRTPTFDRVAREGVLFNHAFCAAPSCTPSRASMLTGQAPHRLEEGGNLHGFLPKRFKVYPDLLEESGYRVGFTRKGWGPGNIEAGGRKRNPAGPSFASFEAFLNSTSKAKPFCFWFGSNDPHRSYEPGSGLKSGLKLEDVQVPPVWPDTREVRSDILDYYFEVERFDREVGELLGLLEAAGRLENTMVVITGDNGWAFPRAKANLYDAGTRQPLAVHWPAQAKSRRVLDDFINLADLAPTFLEAAGLKALPEMTGCSFLGLLTGKEKPGQRTRTFVERERHANVRKGDLSYPARAIRTREYLYIRNFRPDRWPAGDPEMYFAVGPFGDCDGSPTKDSILDRRDEEKNAGHYELCFAKRPAEELYDLARDPHEVTNVAEKPEYGGAKRMLRAELERWMKETADPRAASDDDRWDKYPYFGAPAKAPDKR